MTPNQPKIDQWWPKSHVIHSLPFPMFVQLDPPSPFSACRTTRADLWRQRRCFRVVRAVWCTRSAPTQGPSVEAGHGGISRAELESQSVSTQHTHFSPQNKPCDHDGLSSRVVFFPVFPVSSLCWSSAFLRNDVLSKYGELQWLKCGKSPKIPGEFMIQGARSWASSILPMFPGCRTRRTRRVHMDRLHFFQGTTWQFSRGPPYLKEGNSDPKLLNLSIYIYMSPHINHNTYIYIYTHGRSVYS